jgi:PAS domain-containing protein
MDAYHSTETSEHIWYLPDRRTLRVVITPNNQGGVTYLFDDVTDSYRLQTQYRALVTVQGETLDTLREGVAVFGADGRLKLVNVAFAALWGFDSAQLKGALEAAETERLRAPHVDDVLAHLRATDAQIVLLPRTPEQAASFRDASGIVIPAKPVDGPSLVWAADLVVSAGGTMNREAALLGVPTWTTFAGELGGVDRMLIETGRMGVLERPDQLVIAKRTPAEPGFAALAVAVTEEILRG